MGGPQSVLPKFHPLPPLYHLSHIDIYTVFFRRRCLWPWVLFQHAYSRTHRWERFTSEWLFSFSLSLSLFGSPGVCCCFSLQLCDAILENRTTYNSRRAYLRHPHHFLATIRLDEKQSSLLFLSVSLCACNVCAHLHFWMASFSGLIDGRILFSY